MTRSGGQYKLFETEARFKNGFRYRPDFITEDEEELLLSFIEAHDLKRVTAGDNDEYVGRRHYKNFGWSFRRGQLVPGPELPRKTTGTLNWPPDM